MIRENVFEFGELAALVTGAFFMRNGLAIVALLALWLIGFGNL